MIRVTRGRVRVIGNREEIDNGVIGYLTCRVIHCARHCPDSIIAHPQSRPVLIFVLDPPDVSLFDTRDTPCAE